jgi:hypothetical protein
MLPEVWTVPAKFSALETVTVYVEPLDPGRHIVTVDDGDVARDYKLDAVEGLPHTFTFVPQIKAHHTFTVKES